jgi:hypothetical protein
MFTVRCHFVSQLEKQGDLMSFKIVEATLYVLAGLLIAALPGILKMGFGVTVIYLFSVVGAMFLCDRLISLK